MSSHGTPFIENSSHSSTEDDVEVVPVVVYGQIARHFPRMPVREPPFIHNPPRKPVDGKGDANEVIHDFITHCTIEALNNCDFSGLTAPKYANKCKGVLSWHLSKFDYCTKVATKKLIIQSFSDHMRAVAGSYIDLSGATNWAARLEKTELIIYVTTDGVTTITTVRCDVYQKSPITLALALRIHAPNVFKYFIEMLPHE
jgi:hypothetical protein